VGEKEKTLIRMLQKIKLLDFLTNSEYNQFLQDLISEKKFLNSTYFTEYLLNTAGVTPSEMDFQSAHRSILNKQLEYIDK